MEKKAVYFDETSYNRALVDVHTLCANIITLFTELKMRDMLHVELNDAFASSLVESNGTVIEESYAEHIKAYLEQSNPLMRQTAKEGYERAWSELATILTKFNESKETLFMRYGNIHDGAKAIRYKNGTFVVDEKAVKEYFVSYAEGDEAKLFERIEKCVKEMQELESECKRFSNNRYSFLGTPNANVGALVVVCDDGSVATQYEYIA